MWQELRPGFMMMLVMTVLTGLVYPAVITGISQVVFRDQADGSLIVSSGQVVARGTTIAFEGSTGWSTGPHLHFEVRVYGIYKDPCIWLGC